MHREVMLVRRDSRLWLQIRKEALRGLVCAAVLACGLVQQAAAQVTVLQKRPVRILTSSSPEIFPATWRTAEINAWGKELAASQVDRSRELVNRAFNKYPRRLLRAHLKSVYVLSDLGYFGIIAGGTNSSSQVYIKNDGTRYYTDRWIEACVHHEFSSILLREHPAFLSQRAWQAANPAGFVYGASGTDFVKSGRTSKWLDEAYLRKGFVCQYATATLENDFNCMAEKLFMGEPGLWTAAAKYPAIATKLNLLIGFYQKLNSQFDRAYFQSLVVIGAQ
jgi:hypothetical protein